MKTMGSGLGFSKQKRPVVRELLMTTADTKQVFQNVGRTWEWWRVSVGNRLLFKRKRLERQTLTVLNHTLSLKICGFVGRLFQLSFLCWIIKWLPVLWLVSAHLLQACILNVTRWPWWMCFSYYPITDFTSCHYNVKFTWESQSITMTIQTPMVFF